MLTLNNIRNPAIPNPYIMYDKVWKENLLLSDTDKIQLTKSSSNTTTAQPPSSAPQFTTAVTKNLVHIFHQVYSLFYDFYFSADNPTSFPSFPFLSPSSDFTNNFICKYVSNLYIVPNNHHDAQCDISGNFSPDSRSLSSESSISLINSLHLFTNHHARTLHVALTLKPTPTHIIILNTQLYTRQLRVQDDDGGWWG